MSVSYLSSFFCYIGISTWGKKVGKRWDQLKRSESTELLSVSGRRRRWSPNRKSFADTPDDKVGAHTHPVNPLAPDVSNLQH